jgi:hypothetical protein
MKYLIVVILLCLFGCSNRIGYVKPIEAVNYLRGEIEKSEMTVENETKIRTIARAKELLDTIEIIQDRLVIEYDQELNDLGCILSIRLVKTMGHRVFRDGRGKLWENQRTIYRSFKPNGMIVF